MPPPENIQRAEIKTNEAPFNLETCDIFPVDNDDPGDDVLLKFLNNTET